MIAIVDYGLGNVRAFVNIYARLNIPAQAVQSAEELAVADKIILPGVGSFDWAMQKLEDSGMRPVLDDLVLKRNCSVFGVCVGMQMMAGRSDEGVRPGLAWFDADVKRFDDSNFLHKTRLPHMGWNDVTPVEADSLFKGLDKPRFYFLHSYYFAQKDSTQILATTDYNGSFSSSVRSGHIYGVQFHPEKSHHWGVQLLKNFAEL